MSGRTAAARLAAGVASATQVEGQLVLGSPLDAAMSHRSGDRARLPGHTFRQQWLADLGCQLLREWPPVVVLGDPGGRLDQQSVGCYQPRQPFIEDGLDLVTEAVVGRADAVGPDSPRQGSAGPPGHRCVTRLPPTPSPRSDRRLRRHAGSRRNCPSRHGR